MRSERLEILKSMLRRDLVQSSAEPLPSTLHFGGDELGLTFGNVIQALARGYEGTFRVLPDKPVYQTRDLTHLGQGRSGSLGWNVPPWVEENRGKVVKFYVYEKRRGKLTKPEEK